MRGQCSAGSDHRTARSRQPAFDAFGVRRYASVIKICKHIFATLGLQAFPCGKSGARSLIIWAFPHIYVRSGYILWVAQFTPFPPNLIKRSLAPKNIGQGQPASLRPKGSLSLTRKNSKKSFFLKNNPRKLLFVFYTTNIDF